MSRKIIMATVPGIAIEGKGFSYSKIGKFLDFVGKEPVEVETIESFKAGYDRLTRVHSDQYVRSVVDSKQHNGHYTIDNEIVAQAQAACGAMCVAAHLAVSNSGIVCAPVGGFHHAGYNFGGGGCTFNGIALAIDSLRKSRINGRVLVYDGDAHYGEGCVDIFRRAGRLGLGDVTYMGRNAGIDHKNVLQQLLEIPWHDYSFVFYQAGADAWIEDALGAGYLTFNQLAARDNIVFRMCNEHKLPCVWNLAGGYSGDATMLLHEATWRAYVEAQNAA